MKGSLTWVLEGRQQLKENISGEAITRIEKSSYGESAKVYQNFFSCLKKFMIVKR